jgi:hypothetical protein
MGVRLTMTGRINVGRWLSFTAQQKFVGHDFAWEARAGWGPLKPLHVIDAYRAGRGHTDGRLFGRLRFLHADGENTTRAAAARAAVESIWVPGTLLPDRGAAWRAESDDCIIATIDAPPERPEVIFRIDEAGGVQNVSVMRWGNVGQPDYGYIPFGGHIHTEHRFGGFVLPSQLTVGWWFGTPQFKPFFEATIHDVLVDFAKS